MTPGVRVIAASMPSGVEHALASRRRYSRTEVIAASMPSGVEHNDRRRTPFVGDAVIAASMPSGVEHAETEIARLTRERE